MVGEREKRAGRLWRSEAECCLRGRGPEQDNRGLKEAQKLLFWPDPFGLPFKN